MDELQKIPDPFTDTMVHDLERKIQFRRKNMHGKCIRTTK